MQVRKPSNLLISLKLNWISLLHEFNSYINFFLVFKFKQYLPHKNKVYYKQ